MIKTLIDSGNLGYILFVSVYGLDAIFTIFMRFKRKENIFEAHRSHLYQYMANDMKISHVKVAIGYALVQLLVNYTVIVLDSNELLVLPMVIGYIFILSLVYIFIRFYVYTNFVLKSNE
jgi:hypothetical protein